MNDQLFPQLAQFMPILMFGIFTAFAIFIIRWQRAKMRTKLEGIALSMGGEVVSGFLAGYYVRVQNREFEARIELHPGGKNTPPYLILRQVTELNFDLNISTENVVTRALKKIHLQKEIEIGDPMFDDKYFIATSSAEQVSMFLQSSERRQIVDYFFGAGFSRLAVQMKSVLGTKSSYSDSDLEPDTLRAHLDQLYRFVQGQ